MSKARVSKKRQKIKKRRRLISSLFLMFMALTVISLYFAYDVYTASYEDLDRGEKSDLRQESVNINDDPISILLLGIENYSTGGKGGRADTQIIMTLDPETSEISMTSIPRDTRVRLPEEKVGSTYGGDHKINATYSLGYVSEYGSEKLAVETVEQYMGIPIDHYATINFQGFVEIVDLFDGITVDIKEPFWEILGKNISDNNEKIYFDKGKTTLNGDEALTFVRMRTRPAALTYPRDERQRQLIKATIDEAISAGTVFKVGDIADILEENISTNLSPKDIYKLQKVFNSETSTIDTLHIEGENQRVNGLYYFMPNQESLQNVKTQLKQKLEIIEQDNTK